jgi:CHAT domain-containing protein/Tfp pilus assembly protein PilF
MLTSTSALSIAFVIAMGFPIACSRRGDPQGAYDRAWAAFQHGDLTRADQEAAAGYENFKSLGPEWGWKFAILRARVLSERGMNEDALKLLSSQTQTVPIGELEVQKSRVEGLALSAMHNFPKAEEAFANADRVCAMHNYSPCADVIGARGNMEMARGNYAQAQILFEHVLDSARAVGDRLWEADMLLNLSWAAEEQAHFDEAIDWSDAARKIAVERGAADDAQRALGNMGWAYYKLGEADRAETMFTEAAKVADRLGQPGSQSGWLTDSGYVYMDAGDSPAAGRSFQQSLALARKVNSRSDVINSLIALAFLSEQTNNLPDATRYADEALSMAHADGNKRDETYPRLVQGRIAARQHDPTTAEAAFHEVENSPDSPVFLKWEAEHGLARLYEDENQPDKAASEYRTALTTFESARSELQHENSRLPFLTNATRIYDDYIHLLIAQGKTDEALQVAEFSRARTLSEGLGVLKKGTPFHPDAVNAHQIARTSGGNILFYWLGEKQSYLWLMSPQKTSLFPLPPSSEIDAATQRYRKVLLGPQDVLESSNSEGFALYHMLIEPAKSQLPKNAKLFVIPDGTLNTLNFETLLVPEPTPHYWIEDVTVSDASSLHLLAASQKATKPKESLLLLGNAVTANPDYPELRKAAAEMDSIEKHFPATEDQVFAREQATPVAYLSSKPEQFSYIHFVAHGTASRMSPLDSAIVLSKATAEDDSFKLYARDIIQQPLRAKLVTISTCYGAGSRAYSGEGLVGLSWAFLRAGAHNVIGALWEVSDVSTPQLMDDLYAGLKKGQSPDSALRSAKLALLHSKTAFRKPFYWAPFQLYTRS